MSAEPTLDESVTLKACMLLTSTRKLKDKHMLMQIGFEIHTYFFVIYILHGCFEDS